MFQRNQPFAQSFHHPTDVACVCPKNCDRAALHQTPPRCFPGLGKHRAERSVAMQPGLSHPRPGFLLVTGARTKGSGTFQAKMLEKACRSEALHASLQRVYAQVYLVGRRGVRFFWGAQGHVGFVFCSQLASGSAPFSAMPCPGVPCMKIPSVRICSGCTRENTSVGQQIFTWYL